MHANRKTFNVTQLETGAQQLGVMMTRGYVHNAWPLAPPWPPLRFPFLSSVPTVKQQCTHCLNSQCSDGMFARRCLSVGSSARLPLTDAAVQLTLHSVLRALGKAFVSPCRTR